MDQEKIGKFIAELRKDKCLTQAELGDRVGVTGKAVSRWERGLSIPDVSIINQVSNVLGITTTELLNGEKIDLINQNTLNKISENNADLNRNKFKRILIILIIIILILCLGLLLLFYINNYNNCQLYSISSTNEDFMIIGILNITNRKNTLIIGKLNYLGTTITDIYAIEYKLIYGNTVYFKNGNIETFLYDKHSNKLNINEYLSNFTIYLDDFDAKMHFNNILIDNLSIEFNYVGHNGKIYKYTIPLKLKKEFSNSKFIY